MRLALLVHAASSATAPLDARTLEARLGDPDAGFLVVSMPAHDDIGLGIPRALSGTRAGAALLVHVGAEIARGPTGAVELVGAAQSVRFDELRAAMVSVAPSEALLVVDGVHRGCGSEEDPFESLEIAAAVARAMAPATSGIATLVVLRRPHAEPFAPLWLEAMAAAAQASEGTATLSATYEALREDERVHQRVTALAFTEGARDLVLLRPAPPPRAAFASMPDADETFAEANRLLEEGKLDAALDAQKRVLLLVGDDAGRRAEVFVRVAAIKQRQGKAREAIFNLEKSLSIDPGHRTALEGLVLVAVEEKRFDDVAALGDRLIEALTDADARFLALVDLARIAEDAAGDVDRAAMLLERARALRPFDPDVLERLVALHDKARRAEALCDVLEAYAAATEAPYERAARLVAAAKIAGKALSDPARAIRLYEAAEALRDDDPLIAAALSALLESQGRVHDALEAARRAAALDPRRSDTLRALVRLAGRGAREEVAFQAAAALELLGEADLDEQLLADQHRPEGLLRPQRALDPRAWETSLAPAAGRALMAVFEVIDRAAVAARVDELSRTGKLPVIDPETRQDPATSTLSAVRAFGFAARLLGVEAPDLVLLPEVPGGIAAVPAARATTAVGKQILGGRSLGELSFAMARHLAYHRPGARVALYYPTPGELGALLVASVMLVRPEVAPSSRDGVTIGRMHVLLDQGLSADERERLAEAVLALEKARVRVDATPWLRRLELTATRAGLLASGDLAVAVRMVENDPAPVGDLSADTKVEDLLAFAVSAEHEALRRALGVAVSLRRPAPARVRHFGGGLGMFAGASAGGMLRPCIVPCAWPLSAVPMYTSAAEAEPWPRNTPSFCSKDALSVIPFTVTAGLCTITSAGTIANEVEPFTSSAQPSTVNE